LPFKRNLQRYASGADFAAAVRDFVVKPLRKVGES
jgi:hypothetical protein